MAEENNDNKPNPAEAYANLLKKHNDDANAVALKLFGENFEYRNEIRELKEKQPKDGSLVLGADDAKKWNDFQQFTSETKLDLKTIKETLDKLPEIEQANKKLARLENLRTAADVGIDGSKMKFSVLEKLMDDYPDAEFERKTEKDAGGKDIEILVIKNGEKVEPFTEFAKTNFSDFLPALKESIGETKSKLKGNDFDPKPHSETPEDVVQKEIVAARATGRYGL